MTANNTQNSGSHSHYSKAEKRMDSRHCGCFLFTELLQCSLGWKLSASQGVDLSSPEVLLSGLPVTGLVKCLSGQSWPVTAEKRHGGNFWVAFPWLRQSPHKNSYRVKRMLGCFKQRMRNLFKNETRKREERNLNPSSSLSNWANPDLPGCEV